MIEIKVLSSGSKGNAYYITDGQTPLLLEAGIPWKEIQKKLDFATGDILGCLVTHEHKDHSKALNDLMKAGIDVYTSKGTIAELGANGHRIHPVKAKEQFAIGTWTVLPFDTQHDCAEPLGFLLANKVGEKLLYITDSCYVKYRFKGLTHILVEANYADDILQENVTNGTVPVELRNRIIKSHFSLANVKEFLKANDLFRVREIWLIHLSDNNSDAERFKRAIQSLIGKPVFIA